MKIFLMDKLHQLLHKFCFGNADEDNHIFLDASQVANDSAESSYSS